MSAALALLIFVAALAVYAMATFYIVRWMFVLQLRNWADHMEPFYKPRFIDGIRYAAAIVAGSAHEPRGIREDA